MADYTLATTSHGNRLSRRGLPFVSDVRPMAAAATGINGCLMAVDSNGRAFGTTITVAGGAVAIAGVCRIDVDNSSGGAAAKNAEIEAGDLWLDNDSTNPITQAMIGVSYCYAVDNHTVGSSDVGGTLVLVGVPTELGSTANGHYGKVAVRIAAVTPYAASTAAAAAAFKARGVATNLEAGTFSAGSFTATADGAMATQDGLTVAAGDVLLLPAGTLTTLVVSAANSGPYVVTSIGSASSKVTLSRPSWWAHGGVVPLGSSIDVAVGALFSGTRWASFADKAQTIGTNDPKLYPQKVTQQVTLSAGTKTISNVPILSTSRVGFSAALSGGTPAGTTTAYQKKLTSGVTAGGIGTAAFIVEAQSVAGTIVNTDVAVLNVTLMNG